MTEKKLYTCDICKTDYADKEKAKQCEKNHKLLEKATMEISFYYVLLIQINFLLS